MNVELTADGATSSLDEIVDVAAREPVHLNRDGRPTAVVVSAVVYERLMEAWEDLDDIRAADEALAEIKAGAPTFTLEQVKAELGLDV